MTQQIKELLLARHHKEGRYNAEELIELFLDYTQDFSEEKREFEERVQELEEELFETDDNFEKIIRDLKVASKETALEEIIEQINNIIKTYND